MEEYPQQKSIRSATGRRHGSDTCDQQKTGSDMADSVTGAVCTARTYPRQMSSISTLPQSTGNGKPSACCAIGDDTIDGRPYSEIVEIARDYIRACGGFEKFAEWGLV